VKVAERVLDVDSTLEGERVKMGLDPNATAHLMSVLTDLYSDPVMAVIREYSTNAFDAHVEAGVTRPIEITLPTNLSSYFRVRDFGFGLDADDIRSIYSQYGASTKRESDDVVGMLGLGCKSALTYTDQFTLIGIKNGICTQVSVSRDEDGGGSMTIVDQYETDEPSGVEVVVPVNSYYVFTTKCEEFFRFWAEGTVLVNGEEPKKLEGIKLTDNIFLSGGLDSSYVVMGNVAYPYDDGLYGYNTQHTFTFVNIGDVHFTPSRESLSMTKRTKETLATIKETVARETQAAFQRQIDDAPTAWDAILKFSEVKGLGFNGDPKYKGEDIPLRIESADPKKPYNFRTINLHSRSRGKGYVEHVINLPHMTSRARWFINFNEAEFTPYKQKKLLYWREQNSIPRTEIWIGIEKIPQEVKKWIDPFRIHDWTEVQNIKLPANAPRQDGRPTGSYDIMDVLASTDPKASSTPIAHRSGVEAGDIDTSKPLYYRTIREDGTLVTLLNEAHAKTGYTLVVFGANRIKKFERDFPMAVRLKDAAAKIVKDWENSLTEDDKLYISIKNDYNASRSLSKLDASKIDDPDLANLVKLSNRKDTKLFNNFNRFRYMLDWTDDFENILDKYPLASDLRYGYNEDMMNHVYIYLNAVYAAEKGAK